MNSARDLTAPHLLLQLYVAGASPNSARALNNLNAICREFLDGRFHLEVIDVFEDPLRPLADGVLLTPTLLKTSPAPTMQIIGDLSDRAQVLHALGLVESPS